MRVRHLVLAALTATLAVFASPVTAQPADGSGMAPCGIAYQPSEMTATAHALVFPSSGKTVILYNPSFLGRIGRTGSSAAMFRYLMEHECAHHVLGHIQEMASGGFTSFSVRRFEEEADCYAAKQLALKHDLQALQEALKLWNGMGEFQTGPDHPTGVIRAAALSKCYAAAAPDPIVAGF